MRLATLAVALTLAGCGTYDGGGSVYEYSVRYHEMEQRGEMWVAPDFCGSACTLGLRNTKVCYRPDTVFAFHCVSSGGVCDRRASEAFKSAMPEGVRAWAEATGAFDSTQTVSITGRDLAAIDGRICG